MNEQVNKNVNKNDKIEALKARLAKRKVGAPSQRYFYAVGVALIVCGAAIVALLLFIPKAPDGTIDLLSYQQWKEAHPIWCFLAALVAVAVDVAALDVCGWKVAALIAWRRHRESITVRRVASTRLSIQIAFAVLMVLLYAVFPAYLPHPNGRPPFIGLGILSVPILLAAIQFLRSANSKQPEETRT